MVRPAAILTLVLLATAAAAGQPARTADGQPDLQGVWINASVTSLERPADLAGKEFFSTAEEARAWEEKALKNLIAEGDEAFAESGTVAPTLRTSIIVTPADGRIPYSAEGRKRWDATPTVTRTNPTTGPEDRPLSERCIVWGEGPPLLPRRNNPYLRIAQAPGHVVILTEMIHHARIVPLDDRPHIDARIRQWVGDSRGRWDGDTLVVDTTNFSDKVAFRGSTDALHVVERFTSVDGNRLRYQFTIEDPGAFTQPWSGETYFERTDARMFEYACHEGNRSMELILTGGQAEQATLRRRKLSRIGIAGGAVLALAALGYAVRRRRSAAAEKIS